MRSLKYISTLIFGLLLIVTNVQAQKQKRLQFELSGSYGYSGLSGKISNGSIKPGMGYQISLKGKLFFIPNLGLGIGAGYATYSSQSELTSYSLNTTTVDDENENFEYRVTASGIKEDQKISALEVPVFIAYRANLTKNLGLNVDLGVKLSIPYVLTYKNEDLGVKLSLPLSATYKCTEGSLDARGYYSAYNVELYNMPNHGFVTNDKISYSGNLDMNKIYSIFAYAGISIPVGKKRINIGLYGSNNIKPFLNQENKTLMVYQGSYQSVTSLSDNISLLSGSLLIGITF